MLGCIGVCPPAFAENPKNIAPIDVVWAVDVDQRLPNSPLALSAPAVVEHSGEILLVLGGRDGFVHVYNSDGDDLRRIAIEAPSDSGALALDAKLVVLGDNDGRLYAIDPLAATIVWQTQLTSNFTNAPVAVDGGFIVQTTDNFIYKFSASGEKLWSYAGQNSVLSLYLNATPLVRDGRIYAVLSNGDAVALKVDNGDLLWKRQLLLSNNSAFITELKAPLSTPAWFDNIHLNGESASNVLIIPLYQGELVALNAADGVQLFSLPTSMKSAPEALGGSLYLADSTGYLHAYSKSKGNRLWSKKISQHELIGPVVWHDSLWLADYKGRIMKVNGEGEVQAQVQLVGNIARLPEITATGLLVRTDRGVLVKVQ